VTDFVSSYQHAANVCCWKGHCPTMENKLFTENIT
jgi:hypothetical protein